MAWFSSSFKRKSAEGLQRAGTTARQKECFIECVNARKARSKAVNAVYAWVWVRVEIGRREEAAYQTVHGGITEGLLFHRSGLVTVTVVSSRATGWGRTRFPALTAEPRAGEC